MQRGRFVVASVVALTAVAAARCGGSVGTSPDGVVDASTGSDGPDVLVAPMTGEATPNEGDVGPVDATTSGEERDGTSVAAIGAGADAHEGAADAGADGYEAAADAGADGDATAGPCEAGATRCSGAWTEQCSDAGAWVRFGFVACYYGCYGAGICSGASCPSSCASDDDCASCPWPLSNPYCCDKARGVCKPASAGCSGSTDGGPG